MLAGAAQVRLWDPYDMACIRVLEEVSSEITAMTYYEGWNLLVTGAAPQRSAAQSTWRMHACMHAWMLGVPRVHAPPSWQSQRERGRSWLLLSTRAQHKTRA